MRISPITIAVDAMGGYQAPEAIVAAVASASTQGDSHVYFTLVGDEDRINDQLYSHGHNPERIQVCHAPTSVIMSEPANVVHGQKSDASIMLACALVEQGHADAIVSAGHPGAAILSAIHHFELLPEVEKVALAAVYPTPRIRGPRGDRFSLILDVGATLRAGPKDLLSFALMGSAYSRVVKGLEQPRVALLSNSKESRIGPPEVVEAHQLLRAHPGINFYGNVQGNEIPRGEFDVIVCEGFVGDVALKLLEGAGDAALELARSAYDRKLHWKAGLKLLSGGISRIKSAFDFDEYGGAPLLGIDTTVILAHPDSHQKAFSNALKLAIRNVRSDLVAHVSASLSTDDTHVDPA